MSHQNITKKRLQEVVLLAIKGALPEDKVNDAYNSWLEGLTNSKEFSIIGFIKQFSDEYYLSEIDKKNFKNIIYDNLFIKQNEASKDKGKIKNNPASVVKKTAHLSDQFIIFNEFMKILLDTALSNELDFDFLLNSFNDLIQSTDINDLRQANLTNWIQNKGDAEITESLSFSDMQNAIHTMYLVLCEGMGPVKADNVLSDSVNKAKELPSAHFFSPEKFL